MVMMYGNDDDDNDVFYINCIILTIIYMDDGRNSIGDITEGD